MNIFKIIVVFVLGLCVGYMSSIDLNASDITSSEIEFETQGNMQIELISEAENTSEIDKSRCLKQGDILGEDNAQPANDIALLAVEKSKVEKKYSQLKKEFSHLQKKVSSLNRIVGELDESEVTDKQLMTFVPKSYENLIINYRGHTRDEIFNFHNQPEDLDWGYELSHHINSFITGHAYSFGVEINSVTCKYPNCEILIEEKESSSWERIFQDMTKQDWWKITSTNSSSTYHKDEGLFIYSFLSISH